MDATSRRGVIRRRLLERLLPHVYAVDVWDGPGDGRPCDGCEAPVTAYQHAVQAIASRWLSVYFHTECFEAWKSERITVRKMRVVPAV